MRSMLLYTFSIEHPIPFSQLLVSSFGIGICIYIYIYIYIYQYILDWNSKIVWKFSKLDCLVVKAFEEETYLIPIFEESFKISLKHEIKPYVNYIIHPSNVQLRLSIAYFNSRRNYVITAWHDKRIRRMIGNGRVQFVFLTHSLCPFQTTVCNISLIINYWDIFSLWTVNSGNIYQFCLPIFFFLILPSRIYFINFQFKS